MKAPRTLHLLAMLPHFESSSVHQSYFRFHCHLGKKAVLVRPPRTTFHAPLARTKFNRHTPYVDANGNGWDASDVKLLESKPALDALTGGLLYVGAMQYYAKLREQFERSDRLMKTKTPVIGFLGVVSSVYEAEYVDGTAFSILPGGLVRPRSRRRIRNRGSSALPFRRSSE